MVTMFAVTNLSAEINAQLPGELVSFMQLAGEMAQRQGRKLYLVGGVVRDLLLGRANFDLDLVLEGDAVKLAQELADIKKGKVTVHSRFGTAKLRWDNWSVDLTTARAETYAKPCVLPTVKSASIKEDLFRRDFTINAMAIELSASHYGQLLDLFGGQDDLEHKLFRVLHEKSFIDDATRIWRGLRYEQRLNFRLETVTLQLLKRDISYLDKVSGDRIRHELELVLKEAYPEKVLSRADELGVLSKVHPALKGDSWLAGKFEQARKISSPDSPSMGLSLALLTYRLSEEEDEELISYLRLPKSVAQALRDTIAIKAKLKLLDDSELPPSGIYSILHDYSLLAVMAGSLAGDSPLARQHLNLFLSKLRYIKPALNGEDLKKLGVAQGPGIKEMLNKLLEARLNSEVTSKREEAELVEQWLAGAKR
jgi:tRNA nucleotidyltransferase (CCA-adding enzyme)